MKLYSPMYLLLVPLVLGGEPPVVDVVDSHTHTSLEGVASTTMKNKLAASASSTAAPPPAYSNTTVFPFIIDGQLVASLVIGSNLTVDLANTTCTGNIVGDKCCAGSKCDSLGIITPDLGSMVTFPLIGVPTPTASLKEGNVSELTLTLTFLELAPVKDVTLTSAVITIVVQPMGETRQDYWNLTKASLTINGSYMGSPLPAITDITPKAGYNTNYPACTAPYTPCAPVGLSWTCDDQVLAAKSSLLKVKTQTYRLHLLGMYLQLGNSTELEFNWDCDPLIPLSVLVSILVTLMLASFLLWGIYMLATLQTPTKFDDPKGKSIHVPTNE